MIRSAAYRDKIWTSGGGVTLKFSDNNIGSDLCKGGNLNGIDHTLVTDFVL